MFMCVSVFVSVSVCMYLCKEVLLLCKVFLMVGGMGYSFLSARASTFVGRLVLRFYNAKYVSKETL